MPHPLPDPTIPEPSPSAAPYGPNTPAVRRFLQRFAALRPADWDRAARAYAAADGTAALTAADRALAQAVERAGRASERDAVVGPLVQLVRDVPLAPTVPGGDAALPLLPPVAEAALAALLALVMRDVLPARAFDTLYAPFADLVPVASLDG